VIWACLVLPWHRLLAGSFWLSDQVEVKQCSCGKQLAIHHGMEAVIQYDDEMKAFYARLNARARP
jgi:hypothetical protein